VRERVSALPGVTGAGWISHLPLETWGTNGNFAIEGRPEPARPADAPFAEYRLVGPGYFAALGIPVLAGRDLTPSDRVPERPVVLVNRALAERYFPGESAVGRRLILGDEPSTIVGVVGDVRQAELAREPLPELYVPYFYRDWQEMSLVVDSALPPASLAADVRRAVHAVDPGQAVFEVATMEEVIAGSLADRRLYLLLLAAFAVLATVLTVGGIHGVVSHAVAERQREMAIRLALGARPQGVVGLVVRDGALLAAAGLAIGIPAALLLTRLLESLLHGVTPGDPTTLTTAALLLFTVTLTASWLPARRAARVDPALALAAE
jgi:putative ABC transport system permease protein